MVSAGEGKVEVAGFGDWPEHAQRPGSGAATGETMRDGQTIESGPLKPVVSREEECDDDDEYGWFEPDGYECMCCGHVQATAGFGGTCDRCAGPTTEWYG